MTTKFGWFVSALFVFMVFSLSTATLHAADCPLRGSGAQGVADWAAANVGENCENPATTCNDEFTIELLDVVTDGSLIKFEYEVCRIGGSSALSHFILGLGGIDCLGENFVIGDLVDDVSVKRVVEGESVWISVPYTVGLDPTTQVDGVKYDLASGDIINGCIEIAITFNTSALAKGYTLGVGCTLAATKAGNQDIRRADRATPGYASVHGPVCEEIGEVTCETAFAFADAADGGTCFSEGGFSRWGWTIKLASDDPVSFPVYAGAAQCDLDKGTQVGNVVISLVDGDVLATLVLDGGYFAEEVHVYAGRAMYPTGNNGDLTVAPGQYYVEENLTTADGDVYVIFHAVVCGVYD